MINQLNSSAGTDINHINNERTPLSGTVSLWDDDTVVKLTECG